jgi:hypothetical protein
LQKRCSCMSMLVQSRLGPSGRLSDKKFCRAWGCFLPTLSLAETHKGL